MTFCRANATKATKAAKSPKQASNSEARPGSKKDITEFSSDQNARLIAERRPSFAKAIVIKSPRLAPGASAYTAGFSLLADLDGVSAATTATATTTTAS